MFMMCQSSGLPPISIIGLGLTTVSSDKRKPKPPARMTTFIAEALLSPAQFRSTRPHYAILQQQVPLALVRSSSDRQGVRTHVRRSKRSGDAHASNPIATIVPSRGLAPTITLASLPHRNRHS